VRRLDDGRVAKLVFAVDQRADNHRPLRKAKLRSHWLRTMTIVREGSLRRPNYIWLEQAK
jgi:hypothetical protein